MLRYIVMSQVKRLIEDAVRDVDTDELKSNAKEQAKRANVKVRKEYAAWMDDDRKAKIKETLNREGSALKRRVSDVRQDIADRRNKAK